MPTLAITSARLRRSVTRGRVVVPCAPVVELARVPREVGRFESDGTAESRALDEGGSPPDATESLIFGVGVMMMDYVLSMAAMAVLVIGGIDLIGWWLKGCEWA